MFLIHIKLIIFYGIKSHSNLWQQNGAYLKFRKYTKNKYIITGITA